LMMLDVLAEDGFFVYNVFLMFINLFIDKQLARCRRSLMNLGVHPDSTFLPRGLMYRHTCESGKTCEGSETKSRLVWPLPGPDEEYRMPNIYLFCRLDLEITLFHGELKFPLGMRPFVLVCFGIRILVRRVTPETRETIVFCFRFGFAMYCVVT
jgi:hypothetical protein